MPKYIKKQDRDLLRQYFKDNIRLVESVSELIDNFQREYPEFPSNRKALQATFYRLDAKEGIQRELKPNKPKVDASFEKTIEESKDTKVIEQKTNKQITSLEEAIEFFEVDLDQWEVVTWKCKSWGTSMKLEEITEGGKKISTPITKTNYLVSVNLKKKKTTIDYQKIYSNIDKWHIKPFAKLQKGEGSGIGVLTIADLHTGLKVTGSSGTVNTPNYSIEILINYLKQIAEKTNQQGYKKLYVVILGDLVESVTGYNHLETLKEMEYGITGGNIIIVTYEIIFKFIQSLLNVEEVYIISGNHDRLTPDSRMDQEGGAAQIIAYFLNKSIPTKWHSLVMNVIIDKISYILMHGHLKMSKGDIGKIILQYGKQELYNVLLEAHLHHRKGRKMVASEEQMVITDTSKFRALTVPSIITGNRWSESMGFGSTGGFTITEANTKKDNIHHFDFSL